MSKKMLEVRIVLWNAFGICELYYGPQAVNLTNMKQFLVKQLFDLHIFSPY